MSNGNVFERLWKLEAQVNKLVLDGKRDPEKVANIYQAILEGSVEATFSKEPKTEPTVKFDWTKVYASLGLEAEYAEFAQTNSANFIPANIWKVPVVQGATPNKVVTALRGLGVAVYLYTDDLDTNVTKNDRDLANGSYSVSFNANIEADPELVNKSADTLKAENVNGITLLERLLLEVAYFMATKKHLDEKNVTLCSGSRRSDGSVPYVGWGSDGREVCVSWYSAGYSDSDLRARAVS